jgi:16S rRNA G1207 methylase RsmC
MADRHPPPEHYFSPEPAVATRPREVTVQLPDQTIVLHTDRGVFSLAGLDPGTEVLLRGVPAPPAAATLLDLGCGHGVVAIAIAGRLRVNDLAKVPLSFPTYAGMLGRAAYRAAKQINPEFSGGMPQSDEPLLGKAAT